MVTHNSNKRGSNAHSCLPSSPPNTFSQHALCQAQCKALYANYPSQAISSVTWERQRFLLSPTDSYTLEFKEVIYLVWDSNQQWNQDVNLGSLTEVHVQHIPPFVTSSHHPYHTFSLILFSQGFNFYAGANTSVISLLQPLIWIS